MPVRYLFELALHWESKRSKWSCGSGCHLPRLPSSNQFPSQSSGFLTRLAREEPRESPRARLRGKEATACDLPWFYCASLLGILVLKSTARSDYSHSRQRQTD